VALPAIASTLHRSKLHSFAQIGTTTSATLSPNTGLTASTSYSYRVRALTPPEPKQLFEYWANHHMFQSGYDAASAPPVWLPPRPPARKSPHVDCFLRQLGVTGYRIERCTGASCTSFAQMAPTPAPPLSPTPA